MGYDLCLRHFVSVLVLVLCIDSTVLESVVTLLIVYFYADVVKLFF